MDASAFAVRIDKCGADLVKLSHGFGKWMPVQRKSGKSENKNVAANHTKSAATWWRRGESNPRPKVLPLEPLRAQRVIYIPLSGRERSHFRVW